MLVAQEHFAGIPVKLGKQPARYDPRTFMMATYLAPKNLPSAPPTVDYSKQITTWEMMVNDRVGDCTCAAAGHMILEWTTNAENPYVPGDQQILAAYSAITGYDPVTGANDNGAVVLDVLNYWRKEGVADHKITAYVGLELKNHSDLKDAVYLFENAYLGVLLPRTAQGQKVWSVPPGGPAGQGAPGSWGGHAVPVVAYDARGVTVVTWGSLLRMTWTFYDTYCDEAFAVLSQDIIDQATKKAPGGFDFAALQADLQALDAGTPTPAS
jgi:hypothetical protein